MRGDLLRLFAGLVLALVLVAAGNLNREVSLRVAEDLEVVPPVLVQLALAGGDRYLAANISTWRAIMVGTTRLAPQTLNGLAKIQEDASWFNPAQEDNYYTATAILPWEGKVAETQVVLKRATDGRSDDLWPPFFWGFNQVHFLGDGLGAAKGALIAAERASDQGSQDSLRGIASRWSENGDDLELSIRLVRQMVAATKDRTIRAHLQNRVIRLEGLQVLSAANARFKTKFGHGAESLEQLVSAGMLDKLPVDPLGKGYQMAADGPKLKQ